MCSTKVASYLVHTQSFAELLRYDRRMHPIVGLLSIAASRALHACRLRDGVVSWWGCNRDQALGRDDDTQLCHTRGSDQCRQNGLGQAGAMNEPGHDWTRLTTPVQVTGLTNLQGIEVAVSASSTCARASSADVLCWGQNDVGQMGLGTADSTIRIDAEVVLR